MYISNEWAQTQKDTAAWPSGYTLKAIWAICGWQSINCVTL